MFTLKNRIRVLRAEKDITQETLANAIGVSRQTIIAIENNKYIPSALLAARIVQYFETHFEDIFQLTPSD
jgi:putative transcriptional regulator